MPRSTSTESEGAAHPRSTWSARSALLSVIRRDRQIVITILVFLVLIASMVGYNVFTTANQRDTALVVNITARQRTLVERYIKDVLLKVQGFQADPNESRDVLVNTATALLEGGKVAAPQGSTDASVTISGIHEMRVRRQLEHARDLISQLNV
ncbi:MAG: hypothetical protein QOE00_1011, partial [Ilumatobacteraceae bacterium]